MGKKNLSVFGAVTVLFFVLSFLAVPTNSYSQDLGCCINPSGNCVGCGPAESSCQSQQVGACNNPPGPNGMFVPDEFCFMPTPSQSGVCQPLGCCLIEQGNCFQTTSGTCALEGFGYLGDGDCLPQFAQECTPHGCCQTPGGDPTMCETGVTQFSCENGGGAWTEGVGCDGNFCGQAPPPTGCCQTPGGAPTMCETGVTQASCEGGGGAWTEDVICDGNFCGQMPIEGCCQVEHGICDDRIEEDCPGPFFPDGMCPASGFCEPPPIGCCVCGADDCSQTTQLACEDMGCSYQGDDTSCSLVGICNVEPQGCCVLPDTAAISTSASLLDLIRDHCVIETQSSCENQGGSYQGDGVSCDNVAQCSILPITDVPTIGQWGLIAIAGLLGVFSLLIIMRRHKYNLS